MQRPLNYASLRTPQARRPVPTWWEWVVLLLLTLFWTGVWSAIVLGVVLVIYYS